MNARKLNSDATINYPALTLWLTGLSGAGKSTLALGLQRVFGNDNVPCYVLDGDVLRRGLNCDLGFTRTDRRENVRRIAEVARLFNDSGLIAIVSAISPYRYDRESARRIVGSDRFIEIHVATEIAVCEKRNRDGLYTRARANEIQQFTGVSDPYENPTNPDLRICTDQLAINTCVDEIIRCIRQRYLAA